MLPLFKYEKRRIDVSWNSSVYEDYNSLISSVICLTRHFLWSIKTIMVLPAHHIATTTACMNRDNHEYSHMNNCLAGSSYIGFLFYFELPCHHG